MDNNAGSFHSNGHLSDNSAEFRRAFGWVFGMISKTLLESAGCEVDYRINGERISDISKLKALEIEEKIKLAIADERYEDAAMLKKIRDKGKI